MAYDKAVIFYCKNNSESKQTTRYRIDSCDWGWLVDDGELKENINYAEIDYIATLSSLETVKRYEKNKKKIEELVTSKLMFYKNYYADNKSQHSLFMPNLIKSNFDLYQRCVYDQNLIKTTFEKFFWESGLN